MSFEVLKQKLTKTVCEIRFKHSIGVSEMAVKLAEHYGADINKARVAGLLHDCARDMSDRELLQVADASGILVNDFVTRTEPVLLHAAIGAKKVAEDFNIHDVEILQAIQYHTTGRANMGILEKIIYLADCIEPGRSYPDIEELRLLAFKNLDEALLSAFNQGIQYLLSSNRLIHSESIEGRNLLLFTLGHNIN